ncbi:MAG: UDP-2,3-diacylglucosamine diphosphatase [Legionellales bacterium]|nr:UDP-2,3-diacylglucosamine diphosphatase [Legionellales bacterium]
MHCYATHEQIAFIADVHLRDGYDPLVDQLAAVLQTLARSVRAIYILGDLFDFWISNDCMQTHQRILKCILTTSASCPIYFMPGNRDFLLSSAVCRRFGMTKIADPFMIQHGLRNILLTHGDLLCTEDRSYQLFRRIIQSRVLRGLFAITPRHLLERITRSSKKALKQTKQRKTRASMLANPLTISRWFSKYRHDVLIYGHVHAPSHQQSDQREIVVLDSWEHQINYCLLSPSGVALHRDAVEHV